MVVRAGESGEFGEKNGFPLPLPSADGPDNGAWMCSGSYDYAPTNKLPPPYPALLGAEIDAFCAGEAVVAAAAQRLLISRGGFEYNCFSFIDGRDPRSIPNATDSPAACAAKLHALDHRATPENKGAVVFGSDRTGTIHYNETTSSAQMVATFLLVRDAHWWFGLPSADSFPRDTAALYLTDFGAPLGNLSSSGFVFSRVFEKATVSLDCSTWTATFAPTEAPPS